MATINDGELHLSIEGASEEQLQAGLRAARGIFVAAGCAVEDAFTASFQREGFDMSDDLDAMSDETADKARVLDEAKLAASRAAGFDQSMSGVYLSMADVVQRRDERLSEETFPGPHYRMSSDDSTR